VCPTAPAEASPPSNKIDQTSAPADKNTAPTLDGDLARALEHQAIGSATPTSKPEARQAPPDVQTRSSKDGIERAPSSPSTGKAAPCRAATQLPDDTTKRKSEAITDAARARLQFRPLLNLGNTCYMNSAVQLIRGIPPLVDLIATHKQRNTCKLSADRLPCVFCALDAKARRKKPRKLYRLCSCQCGASRKWTQGLWINSTMLARCSSRWS
jgi:hypothetical protein